MLNLSLPTDLPTIGDRIRWAIEHDEAVRTQAKLAELLGGVSRSAVNQLVQNTRKPGKGQVRKLSKVLNVPESWIMYGVVPKDGDGGGGSLEQAWAAELRRISELQEPESRKVLYRDSLAAVVRSAWAHAAEVAAEARARAVEQAEAAAARRAEAVSSAAVIADADDLLEAAGDADPRAPGAGGGKSKGRAGQRGAAPTGVDDAQDST